MTVRTLSIGALPPIGDGTEAIARHLKAAV